MNDHHATEPVEDSTGVSFPDFPTNNSAFLPSPRSLPARHSLTGILKLPETPIHLCLDDLAKIANLFHRKGSIGTEQLLSFDLLAAATDPRVAKGLPTGDHGEHGAITYHLAFWHYPYRSLRGQTCYIPAMRGYGGNILMLLSNGMSAFRIANDIVSNRGNPYDALSFVRLADR
jgi:hypothetical protein